MCRLFMQNKTSWRDHTDKFSRREATFYPLHMICLYCIVRQVVLHWYLSLKIRFSLTVHSVGEYLWCSIETGNALRCDHSEWSEKTGCSDRDATNWRRSGTFLELSHNTRSKPLIVSKVGSIMSYTLGLYTHKICRTNSLSSLLPIPKTIFPTQVIDL